MKMPTPRLDPAFPIQRRDGIRLSLAAAYQATEDNEQPGLRAISIARPREDQPATRGSGRNRSKSDPRPMRVLLWELGPAARVHDLAHLNLILTRLSRMELIP